MSRIGSFLNRSNLPVHHSDDPKKNQVNNKKLAEYASPAQQRALETNDAESLQIADDEALAWAIQASLNEQTDSIPLQNKTPTPAESLQIADDQALAQAIQASLNERTQSSALQNKTPTDAIAKQIANDEAIARAIQAGEKTEKKPSKTSSIAVDLLRAQSLITNKLRTWFNQNGYRVIPNNGKSNNCLLISLLQHATGDYTSQHSEKAAKYKSILETQSKGDIGLLDPLYSDTPLITALIKRIGQDHGHHELSVNFCFPDIEGNLAERTVGSGLNPVWIFDQGGHFEAVLPPIQKP